MSATNHTSTHIKNHRFHWCFERLTWKNRIMLFCVQWWYQDLPPCKWWSVACATYTWEATSSRVYSPIGHILTPNFMVWDSMLEFALNIGVCRDINEHYWTLFNQFSCSKILSVQIMPMCYSIGSAGGFTTFLVLMIPDLFHFFMAWLVQFAYWQHLFTTTSHTSDIPPFCNLWSYWARYIIIY